MENNMFRKGLVLAVIVLFVGAGITQSISWNIGKLSDLKDIDADTISVQSDAAIKGDLIYVSDNLQECSYVNISVIQAKEMIDEDQDVFLLDVREPDEYSSGHIEGAVSASLIDLECEPCLQKMLNQHKEENIIVYCKTGVRSKEACNILLNSGFNHVYNLLGGITAWKEEGYPVSNQVNEYEILGTIDQSLRNSKPVFLFFYTNWCGYSKKQMLIIDELEQEYADKIAFIRVNAEENPQAMDVFGVTGFPAMFLIVDKNEEGYVYQEFDGFTEKETLEESFDYVIENGSLPEDFGCFCSSFQFNQTDFGNSHSADSKRCPPVLESEPYKCKCPPEKKKGKRHNENSVIYSNGCSVPEWLILLAGIPPWLFSDKDNPEGHCSFKIACDNHDCCYGTCNKPRYLCDKYFHDEMKAACYRCYEWGDLNDWGLKECNNWADIYWRFVVAFGDHPIVGKPYSSTQEKACEECCCDGCEEEDSPRARCGVSPNGKSSIVTEECIDCKWIETANTECPDDKICEETANGPICKKKDEEDDDHGDTPDDNYDVSTPKYFGSTSFDIETRPNVAILSKGNYISASKLLESFYEPTIFVHFNFLPDLTVEEYPVLIIPTGGLFGLDSSPTFRSNLAQYVENGGTLIVFSQQHGYEYSALPGSNLSGYGWREDQSCQHRSVYIDTYHPILSGQDSITLDVVVDGYFTKRPENATVLLSRTKNGMPAMLMYNYCNGTVIASTLYEDWGYTHYQSTQDGRKLLRDAIAWAKDRKDILEYGRTDNVNISVNVTGVQTSTLPAEYPWHELGDTVNISANVTNYANITSDKISFEIFDQDYEIEYVNFSVFIPSNESQIVNFTYPTTNESKKGAYLIIYLLYANETAIGVGFGEVFVLGVNTTELSTYKVNLTLKDPDKNIVKQGNMLVYVPAGETKTVNFTYANPSKLGIWQLLYEILDYNNTLIDSGTKKFAVSKYAENPDGWVYQGKNISFTLSTPDEEYPYGSDVPFTIHIWNHGDADRTITYNTYYQDWSLRSKLPEQNVEGILDVPAGGTASATYVLHVGNIYLSHDQLIIRASFSEGSNNLGRTEKVVYMFHPAVDIQVETDKMEYGKGEDIFISLNITNKKNASSNTTVTVRILNPDNNKVFEYVSNVTLNAFESQSEILIFDLPIETKHGIYLVFVEAYSNERKIGSNSVHFEVFKDYFVKIGFDKPDKIYAMRQNLTVFINASNPGQSPWDSMLDISIPSLDFNVLENMSVNPSQTESLIYNFRIPENITAGKHDVILIVSFDNSTTEGAFFIPDSELVLDLERTNYTAGENLSITLTNIGGIDTEYDCNVELHDSKQLMIYSNNSQGDILAGEIKTLGLSIPSQTAIEDYFLLASCKDKSTNRSATLAKSITIEGLKCALSSVTNKETYFNDEDILIQTDMTNLNGEIVNGLLELTLTQTTQSMPGGVNVTEAWVARYQGLTSGFDRGKAIAVDGMGNVYVTGWSQGSGTVDDYPYRDYHREEDINQHDDFVTIKYDSNGTQLWIARYDGPASSGDGAVAIAIDGLDNVYVTGTSEGNDTSDDYATIKYDSNGTELWVARYTSSISNRDEARAITLDGSGNVYVTGTSYDNGIGINYATIKYDTNGNQLWVARYGGPGDDWRDNAEDIVVDESGNVYVTGTSKGNGTSYDYATIKYDSNGTELWVARYGSSISNWDLSRAITLDGSGNVYVTGDSIGGSATGWDYATVKYANNGTQLWVARYEGSRGDYVADMAVDDSGNIYVTGRSQGNGTGNDYATIKYDTNGTQLWIARYNAQIWRHDEAKSIAVDDSGNVFVAGLSYGYPSYNYVYAIIKYDSNGTELWIALYNASVPSRDQDDPYRESVALVLDQSGKVYVGCASQPTLARDYHFDYTTIKYNSTGDQLWVTRYDSVVQARDETSAMVVDSFSNVYVTGYSGSFHYRDYLTVKYDANGNQLWIARYDGPASKYDDAVAIAIDGLDNVYVTGTSYGNGTENDYATIKYDSNGNQLWVARYDGPVGRYDEAKGLALDNSGNVYVTGYSYGDYATIKYDSNGNQLWVARYDGGTSDRPEAITLDGEGNVYVTGGSYDGGWDYATIKYDSNGNQLWVVRYNGPENYQDRAFAIAADSFGNSYVTGESYFSSGRYSDATVKYDTDGNELWVISFSTLEAAGIPVDLALDSSGNVFITGFISQPSYWDYSTVKIDSNGTLLWIATYDGLSDINRNDRAAAMAVDDSGNAYVTGYSSGNGTWYDYATIKYDAYGNQSWVARYAGESTNRAEAIALDGSGSVYVTGSIYNAATSYDYATIKYVQRTEEIILEKTIPINLSAYDLQSIVTDISIPGEIPQTTGKVDLVATLYSELSQTICRSNQYSFFITDSNLSLILQTDKPVYKPNETIRIYGNVTNNAQITDDFSLSIKKDGVEIFFNTVTLAEGESYHFDTTTLSETSFTLEGAVNGTVDGTVITNLVEVAEPTIDVEIIAPDIVGIAEFNVGVLLENVGEIGANLSITIEDESWEMIIPKGESRLIETNLQITEDTLLEVIISGDVEETFPKQIIMGEYIEMEMNPQSIYLEGEVDIPFVLKNTGQLDSRFDVIFFMASETAFKNFFVPAGEELNESLSFYLSRGDHVLRYSSPFEQGEVDIHVGMPEFILTSSLANTTFTSGSTADMNFTIRNIGGAEGEVTLYLMMPDFEDTGRTWIKPGEEENISFSFIIPEDLEEKTYKGIYELNGQREEFAFFVYGANISIEASLDKELYEEGETAVLTLDITNECGFDLSLYARVKLGGYEEIQYFNLSDTVTLQFNVPVSFNGQKLFYGIYMESGRALYLNSVYVQKKEDIIILYTNKQVYKAGENITIIVEPTENGNLSINAPGYNVSMYLDGPASLEFTLPEEMRSGTYYIDYTFDNFSSAYPFDVIGYSARILECSLDKDAYTPSDIVTVSMNIEVNRDIFGVLKTWIYDSQYNLIDTLEMDTNYVTGENRIEVSRSLSSNLSGIHMLAYSVYAHSDLIFLASGAEYFDVIRLNEPPVADADGPYVGDEGQTITFDASNTYDPDGDALQYRWDFDNNGIWDTTYSTNTTANYTWYDDHNGIVALEVSDGEFSDINTSTVIINNVAPTITSLNLTLEPIAVETNIRLIANFTDPGSSDTHNATIHWNDGNTSVVNIPEGNYTTNYTYNYSRAGVYTIKLIVEDDDNGNDSKIFQYVVVYDPNDGFVTGGGWINSPEGAYTPDPGLSGKANFGFVSKYKKGQQTPTGNTEFQFKAANMNFHSSSYDWLVIAGAKAMYKGTGTINGTGNYGFMLSAIDEKLTPSTDVDMFRIKIWDKDDDDNVIYDNQLGDPEDGDPTTAIGGGQIVIHKS